MYIFCKSLVLNIEECDKKRKSKAYICPSWLGGGHIVTLVFIPKLESKQLDLSMEDSTIFLSVMGLTNFIGRLVVGWICQKKMACPLIIHCLGHLGSSVCLILYHFITNYWLMAAAVAIQGVAQVWLLQYSFHLFTFSIEAFQNIYLIGG